MINRLFFSILLTISFLLLSNITFGQQYREQSQGFSTHQDRKTRMLFVFDASRSMYGKWGEDTKINIARKLLIQMIDSLQYTPDLEMALRVYGHQFDVPPQVCTDTKLEVPFAPGNVDEIKSALYRVIPRGTTPISYALEESAHDFPQCDNCKNIIILITDGLEECGGDPCEVSLRLQKRNIFLRPFVIGIGHDYSSAFECVGTYLDATSEESFKQALNIVVSKALNNTTTQVNLLDIYGNPNESDVTMTFFDHNTGQIRYNYIHTLDGRGLPDTIYIDPVNNYDMLVHTIPPVFVEDITITAGRHNIISADAPQGSLRIACEDEPGASLLRNVTVVVKEHNKCSIINTQEIKEKVRYLVGKYDVEILTTPSLILEGVELSQNHTTTLTIPVPGTVYIEKQKPYIAEIFVAADDSMKLVKRLETSNSSSLRLNLMPNDYILVVRPAYSRHAAQSNEYPFAVKSGQTTKVVID